jgi:predicted enzyme related to lactoylglutathione lyase
MDKPPMPVLQMRLVVEADDYDRAIAFYRDALGLPEELAVSGPDGANVTILAAGRATLEIANPAQKDFIDRVETGRAGVAPKLRVAFEVADVAASTETLVASGATLIAAPVETPWRSLNARLAGPGGLQLTLFQELDPADPTQPPASAGAPRARRRGS